MNNAQIIRTLEAFREYTRNPFGKYAADLALNKLKGGIYCGAHCRREIFNSGT